MRRCRNSTIFVFLLPFVAAAAKPSSASPKSPFSRNRILTHVHKYLNAFIIHIYTARRRPRLFTGVVHSHCTPVSFAHKHARTHCAHPIVAALMLCYTHTPLEKRKISAVNFVCVCTRDACVCVCVIVLISIAEKRYTSDFEYMFLLRISCECVYTRAEYNMYEVVVVVVIVRGAWKETSRRAQEYSTRWEARPCDKSPQINRPDGSR